MNAIDVDDRMRREARVYGASLEVNPYSALLDEINRTAGHVAWLSMKLQEAPSDDALLLETMHAPWLRLYQRERAHLTKSATDAVKLGIAERAVTVAETQAELTARALTAVLDQLGLSDEQRARAPSLLRRELLALEAAQVDEA